MTTPLRMNSRTKHVSAFYNFGVKRIEITTANSSSVILYLNVC
jgi:hypothetical protein